MRTFLRDCLVGLAALAVCGAIGGIFYLLAAYVAPGAGAVFVVCAIIFIGGFTRTGGN